MKTDQEMVRWALEESSEPVIKNPYLRSALTQEQFKMTGLSESFPGTFTSYNDAVSEGFQGTREEWLQQQSIPQIDRPLTGAQGGRVGLQSGQLVQPGPGRQGYAGDDFITFPLKKYSDAILDKQIRLVSTKPGISQYGAPKTLREIFEVVTRTQGGQTMIDEFKKNPTEEAFTKLRRRRKYRLDFEKDQKLSPKEKSRLRKQQYQSEKKMESE